jgi:hypothetical protein
MYLTRQPKLSFLIPFQGKELHKFGINKMILNNNEIYTAGRGIKFK